LSGDAENQIKEILSCLLSSEYPYKDIPAAVEVISGIMNERVSEVWARIKPKQERVWYEISPGRYKSWDPWKVDSEYEDVQEEELC
jgi:hypothetical protein